MPPVVAFLTAVGTFVTAGVALGATAAIIGTIAVVGASVLASKLLTPKVNMGVVDSDRARQTTVRSTIEPRKLVYGETMISGVVSFAQVDGANNKNLHQVIAIAGHKLTSIDKIYFDDYSIDLSSQVDGSGDVTSGTFAKKTNEDGTLETMVHIETRVGSSTQTAYSGLVTAFAGTGAAAGTGYESTHRGDNVASIYTRWTIHEGSAETWDEVGGIQNIKAVVKGKAVYDPRLDVAAGNAAGANPTTAAYIKYSDGATTGTHQRDLQGQNPALMLADYLMDDKFGLGLPASKIDWPAVVTAADACDFLVPIPVSQTQKRFFGSGVIFGSDSHRKSISKILSGMNGDLIYSQGKYIIKAGIHEASSLAITEDDLAGDFTVKTSIPRADRFNTIKGMFIDPESNYKMTEFAPRTVTGAVARDNGEVLEEEIKLTFTSDRYVAQRIAIKKVNQSFLQTTLSLPVNLKGMKVAVGDRITLALNDFATISSDWNPSKEFKVIGWSFSESGSGAIDLSLIEDDSARYADPAEGEYNQISNTGVITTSLADVPSPTNFTATAGYNSVNLEWTNPTDTGTWEQIWIFASDTTTPPATPIEKFRGTAFTHQIAGGTAKYSWIQAVKYPLGATPAAGSTNTAKSALVPFGAPTVVTALKIANAVMADDSIDTAQIITDAVGSEQIAQTLQSSNWSVPNQTGWQISKNGDTTFNNTVVRGNISASTGSIGGITVDADSIHVGTGTFNDANTQFYADDQGRFSLEDKLSWDGTTLTVNGGGTFTGVLSAATGTFTGELSGGTISIGSNNDIFKADSNGIYLGNATFASAPFRVAPDGSLTSTTANLTGALTATSLNITNTATVTDTANLINNVAIREEVLRVEVTTGDVLDLETGGEVEIQNLGDVAIYVSNQDAILQGNINTVSNALSNLENTVVDLTSGVSDIFIQTTAPVAGVGGIPDPIPDFSRWYDSDDDNHPYYWTGSAWVSLEDPRIAANAVSIQNLNTNLSTTNTNVAANTTLAQGKIQSYFQDAEPSGGTYATGDLWFDTDDKNKTYRYSGSAWVAARDSDIAQAISDASDAQATADGKVQTFIQDAVPQASDSGLNALFVGDLWIDSNDDNKLYRYNGSAWALVRDSGIEANAGAISTLDATVSDIDDVVTALSTSNTSLVATIDFITKVSDEDGDVLEDESSTSETPVVIDMQDLTDVASATGQADQTLQTRVTSTEDTIVIQSTELTVLNSILTDGDGNLSAGANAVSALQTDVTQINTLDGTSTSANASALVALKSIVEDPSTGLSAVGGVVSTLTANVGDGAVLVSDAQTLYAVTGLVATDNWDVAETYAAGSGVVYLGIPYVAAVTNTGETPLNNLSNWTPADTTASLITDNNVSRIGYCVDSAGNLTDHKNATLCVAAGNTWNGDAALAEAVKALTVIKPDGTYATIQDASSVISDDVGDVIAQKYVKIDANGAIAGYGLYSTTSSGQTESEFVVMADKFKVVDPANTALTALAPFTVTAQKIVMGTDVEINGNLLTTGTTISNVALEVGSEDSFFKASSDGLQLGSETFESAPFRVNPAGALTATSANITGDIVANNLTITEANITGTLTLGGGVLQDGDGNNLTTTTTLNANQTFAEVSGASAFYRITTNTAVAPTNAEFLDETGRYAKVNDIVITTDTTVTDPVTPNRTYGWSCTAAGTASTEATWDQITDFISGDLLVDGTITADQIAANAVTAAKISVTNLQAIQSDLGNITAGTLKGGTVPDADAAPSGTESGSFFNLTGGKFVVGNATNNVLFDGSTLAVTGAITATSLALSEGITIAKSVVGLTNVDDVSQATIQSDTLTAATSSDVGLGSVENLDAQNQAQTGLIAGTTITNGGITMSSGGAIKTAGKDSESNTTNGYFLGYNSSSTKYTFGIGDADRSMVWDGSKLNISGDSISLRTGGDVDYTSDSRYPTSVKSSAITLTSDSDYFLFDTRFQDIAFPEFLVTYNLGPLTSGTQSGLSAANGGIMDQIKVEVFYSDASSGSPSTWVSFASKTVGKIYTWNESNSAIYFNFRVKQVDLGGGNYRADLDTRSGILDDYPLSAAPFSSYFGGTSVPVGLVDEDYNINIPVYRNTFVLPKGKYFIKTVITVTNGSTSPYPSTGSPTATNRIVSIANANNYTHPDYGQSSYYQGNPKTTFVDPDDKGMTLLNGNSVYLMTREGDSGDENWQNAMFFGGRGTSNANAAYGNLHGLYFYNDRDDIGNGNGIVGSLGSVNHAITVPYLGDSLNITATGNGIKFNGGYGSTGATIDTNGNYFANGNITISGTVSQGSDARLKTDVETIDGSKVFDMRGVSFIKAGKKGAGVIAQELQEIAPELVHENEDGVLSVAYGDIVGYLIEAIKTLKQEIESIKADD